MEDYLRQRHKAHSEQSGDKFWSQDYGVLLRNPGDVLLGTKDSKNMAEKFNAYTRFAILLIISISIVFQSPYVLLLIPISMVLIAVAYDTVSRESETERYGEKISKNDADYVVREVKGVKCRAPTENNPFMTPNYLVDPPEILSLPACSSVTRDALDEGRAIYDSKTPYDIDNAVSGTDESSRRFFAMYTIGAWPPETEAFAKWLHGADYPDQRGKDGYGYSCREHDDSAPKFKYSCRADRG